MQLLFLHLRKPKKGRTMKKILVSFAAVALMASSSFALTVDTESATAHCIGKKQNNGTKVDITINEGKYTFAKNEGSVAEMLNGAKIELDFANFYSNDKTRVKNITRTFLAALKDSKINVEFKDAAGDDAKGTAKAAVSFNGGTQDLECSYEVVDGKLKVSAVVNMTKDFNLNDAYVAMSTDKQIMGLHGKKTWEDVEIYLSVDVK